MEDNGLRICFNEEARNDARIKVIGVVALFVGRFEALPKFQVEYKKSQPVRRFEVFERFGKP